MVIAKTQTHGVGRQGRTWESPPGGLYVSFLLKPGVLLPDLPYWLLYSLWHTLEMVAQTELTLKWPNDILYQGLKLAGQLIDSQILVTQPLYYVCGIGINLQPGVLSPHACSLADMGSVGCDWEDVLAQILFQMEKIYTLGQQSPQQAWQMVMAAFAHRLVQMDYNGKEYIPFEKLRPSQGPAQE